MAYADRDVASSRVVAIVVVSIILAAIGYVFVTGLAYQYVKKVSEKLNTFDVDEPPPPPPDEPPPPPPDVQMAPPPVVSPPPIVTTNAPIINVIPTVTTPPPVYIPTPVVAPPPPPPAPPRVSQAASVRAGDIQRTFGDPSNYPPAAQRAGASGRVVVKLAIGTDGRVSDCSVATSSGNSDLDNATCRISRSRLRFTAAKDDNGAPIQSSYTLPVRWALPQE